MCNRRRSRGARSSAQRRALPSVDAALYMTWAPPCVYTRAFPLSFQPFGRTSTTGMPPSSPSSTVCSKRLSRGSDLALASASAQVAASSSRRCRGVGKPGLSAGSLSVEETPAPVARRFRGCERTVRSLVSPREAAQVMRFPDSCPSLVRRAQPPDREAGPGDAISRRTVARGCWSASSVPPPPWADARRCHRSGTPCSLPAGSAAGRA